MESVKLDEVVTSVLQTSVIVVDVAKDRLWTLGTASLTCVILL